MKRYLSIWLPDWPLDRLRRARRHPAPPLTARQADLRAFVLYERSAHGLNVVAANAPARAAGIIPGLRLTDARATLPDLHSAEHDPEADRKALAALAAWMVRISPLVSLDGNDGLIIETTGCDHLLGGEAKMAAEVSRRLEKTGYDHRIAIAGTPGAAHALARSTAAGHHPVVPTGQEREGLANLPMAGLRLSAGALRLLRRFGLTRIGQLYDIDRKALARRFRSREAADAVCLRLDQALGRRAEPFAPFRAPPEYVRNLPCPEPLLSPEGIFDGLQQLTVKLCAALDEAGVGAHRFTYRAFLSDGETASVCVYAARPVRTPDHILRLFREKLDRIDPGFGIDHLQLEADRTDTMTSGSRPLSGDLSASDFDTEAIAALADRIMARLGEEAVTVRTPLASYLPEHAERSGPYTGEAPAISATPPWAAGPRPLRMLARPEHVKIMAQVPDGPPLQFIWRRQQHRVLRADGPERIAPEWWTYLPPAPGVRGNLPRTRDYYRIEDSKGRRYWVFREGLYDDNRGTVPEWFVQGLFA